MNRAWIYTLTLAAAMLFAGCKPQEAPPADKPVTPEDLYPKEAQPKLPTAKLWIGSETLITELAVTEKQMMTGMMFRTNMADNEAMLFAFEQPFQVSFWMKNTILPLSCAYISPDGTIQEIHDLQPEDTNAVMAASPNIQFVIETTQGWFKRHNVSAGAVVQTEKGSLMDLYRGKQ